jgi:hypothetical protein
MPTRQGGEGLAAERVDEPVVVHVPGQRDRLPAGLAGLRLCRCGRLHPCDERRYWHATKIHYQAIIDSR